MAKLNQKAKSTPPKKTIRKAKPATAVTIPLDALRKTYLAWALPGYTAFENLTLAQIDRIAKAFMVAKAYKI